MQTSIMIHDHQKFINFHLCLTVSLESNQLPKFLLCGYKFLSKSEPLRLKDDVEYKCACVHVTRHVTDCTRHISLLLYLLVFHIHRPSTIPFSHPYSFIFFSFSFRYSVEIKSLLSDSINSSINLCPFLSYSSKHNTTVATRTRASPWNFDGVLSHRNHAGIPLDTAPADTRKEALGRSRSFQLTPHTSTCNCWALSA